MALEWQQLTDLTQGRPFVVEKVRIEENGVALEGSFELPSLARLRTEDQVFVMAFVRSHGSIKKMEELFGVSYPTIKNRLNRIGEQLEFVEVDPAPPRTEILEQIERGDLSVADAVAKMKR